MPARSARIDTRPVGHEKLQASCAIGQGSVRSSGLAWCFLGALQLGWARLASHGRLADRHRDTCRGWTTSLRIKPRLAHAWLRRFHGPHQRSGEQAFSTTALPVEACVGNVILPRAGARSVGGWPRRPCSDCRHQCREAQLRLFRVSYSNGRGQRRTICTMRRRRNTALIYLWIGCRTRCGRCGDVKPTRSEKQRPRMKCR